MASFQEQNLFCGKVCIDTITNGKPLQAWLPNINLTMAEFRAKHLLVHRAKSCRTRPFDISWMTAKHRFPSHTTLRLIYIPAEFIPDKKVLTSFSLFIFSVDFHPPKTNENSSIQQVSHQPQTTSQRPAEKVFETPQTYLKHCSPQELLAWMSYRNQTFPGSKTPLDSTLSVLPHKPTTLPKTIIAPKKMDDWIFLLGPGLFSGDLLVSGRVPGMRVVPQDASVACRDDLHSLRFPKHISNMIFHPFLGFSQHQMGIFATHPKKYYSQNGFISSKFSKWEDQSSLKLAPSWMDSSNFFKTFSLRIMNKNTISHFPTHQVGPCNKMYTFTCSVLFHM